MKESSKTDANRAARRCGSERDFGSKDMGLNGEDSEVDANDERFCHGDPSSCRKCHPWLFEIRPRSDPLDIEGDYTRNIRKGPRRN